jgi:ABC-type dipeptide/oligopeptide/nickel transport system ATPase component
MMRGEVLGGVGGSGSGKWVLLRTILGLNKPAAGKVEMYSEEVCLWCDRRGRDTACRCRREGGLVIGIVTATSTGSISGIDMRAETARDREGGGVSRQVGVGTGGSREDGLDNAES